MVRLRDYVAQAGGLGTGKMVCLRNFVAQQGGLGTGKMLCLRTLWLSKVV